MLLDSGEAGEAAQGILPLSRLEFDEATSTGNPHFLLERPAAEGALRFGRRISQGVAAQARAQLSQKSRDLPALGDAMVETDIRSEEHTSELQSLMRSSYAVFCLKKKKTST